ncbi:MAG TPA: hypothetical protein VG387_01735 [Rhizomicrobium sp.]|jgi:hypothetical protein|nr:hypothetical protein [Rhizomicrobium sp.]
MPKKRTGPPKRRNTLTLDDDNAIRLERLRAARDVTFKEIVNDVLRKGLAEEERPFRHQESEKPFKIRVFDGGKPNFQTTEELKALMEEIQLEEDMKKLGLK